MIQALAPGMRWGFSWVWLSVALAGAGWPAAVAAQDGKPATKKADETPAAKTSDDAPAAKKGDDAPAKKEEPGAAAPAGPGSVEVFKDPHAEKALAVFKSVPGLRDTTPQVISQVKAMAAGQANTDGDTVRRFVEGMAYRLIDKSNINGLIAPPPTLNPNSFAAKAIKETSDNLIDALNAARQTGNSGFIATYNRALIETLPKLLDNNLVARIEAMIVLGQTGDPAAVPIFVKQLKDPNQTVWVKLWAARGLSNVTGGGTRVDSVLSVQQASEAGKAVADFLNSEEDVPWPAQVRALEAIGALRQAALPTAAQKVDMAAAAMQRLADPESRPEVRAAAAWALGMVRVNPIVTKYNFGLVAHDLGALAADLGETANASFAANRTLSEYCAGLLVGPVFQAFNGLDGVRESGLLKTPHPNFGPNQGAIRQIADLESSVAKAAVELVRAPNGQIKARTKDLGDRVGALKLYLEKNPPKDFHLVPGGPEYRPGPAQVADAAKANDKPAAGAPGGE